MNAIRITFVNSDGTKITEPREHYKSPEGRRQARRIKWRLGLNAG